MTVSTGMRKKLAIVWLILLSLTVGGLYWRMEWQYGLPTPIPAHYHAIERGTSIRLPSCAVALQQSDKPLFLHFFNPDCPCSRFNMPQFRALVQQYGNRVSFAIVVMSSKTFTAAQLQEKFNLPYIIPVVQDSALAVACGVYSTPQAVLIDRDSRLYFRGNYNRSRYCSNEKTGFARQALDGLLARNYSLTFSPLALKAYGCQLPTCNQ
jgi:Iodothyronine deiodinase